MTVIDLMKPNVLAIFCDLPRIADWNHFVVFPMHYCRWVGWYGP